MAAAWMAWTFAREGKEDSRWWFVVKRRDCGRGSEIVALL